MSSNGKSHARVILKNQAKDWSSWSFAVVFSVAMTISSYTKIVYGYTVGLRKPVGVSERFVQPSVSF